MVSKSDWLVDVSSGIPGCDKITIDKEVMNIIRDFCQETLLWVEKLDLINVVAGTAEYVLSAPVALEAVVVTVERAEFNGSFMGPDSMDLLDQEYDSWRAQTAPASTEYMVDAKKVLRLRYTPTENITGGLAVWASLKPAIDALTIPDFVYDEWYDCIKYGVWGRLFKIPKKAWTNIREGEYFEGLYHERRSSAKKQKRIGKTKLKLAVQRPPFYVI